MNEQVSIYPAAALFNGRETIFNSLLVEGLEKLGYKTNFPQRDGFEFGDLSKTLDGKLLDREINTAAQNIIYYLDMGVFLPKSDVILANFDEPLDEGVIVEASYATLMGKFVIGLRTDVRSPYGSLEDAFRGMHFFPAYQAHRFIYHSMPSRTHEERKEQIRSLVDRIHRVIEEEGISHQETLPDYATQNPNIKHIMLRADLLFKEIPDIHSNSGIEEIASRYLRNRELFTNN